MAHTDCGHCWENKLYKQTNFLEIKNILFLFKWFLSNSETADSFLNMTLETACCFANNNDAGLMSGMGNISTLSLAAQDCCPAVGMGGDQASCVCLDDSAPLAGTDTSTKS